MARLASTARANVTDPAAMMSGGSGLDLTIWPPSPCLTYLRRGREEEGVSESTSRANWRSGRTSVLSSPAS